LSFAPSKPSTIAVFFVFIVLTIWAYFEYRSMTSIFKTDLGNGVVIYADDYVKSGNWVFDCDYSRLISRPPLPPPFDHLKQKIPPKTLSIFPLSPTDKAIAKELIQKLAKESQWHQDLRYLYSGIGENSELSQHWFYTTTEYENRIWAIYLIQAVENEERSRFYILATPYDPETFVDYEKAMQQAKASCPTPQ